MSTKNVLNAALYTRLSGGTVLTAMLAAGSSSIYYLFAPEDASLPYVVFSHTSGGPSNDTPSDDRDQLVFVRGYASTSALAGSIDSACSTLLHRQALSVSGYSNYWTSREQEFETVEHLPNKSPVYMNGADYRIRLDS